jgi:hypothetical protein
MSAMQFRILFVVIFMSLICNLLLAYERCTESRVIPYQYRIHLNKAIVPTTNDNKATASAP